MRCSTCDAPLDVSGVFPGGDVRCACGATSTVPDAAPIAVSPPSHNAPYREAHVAREAAALVCPFCGGPCSPDARACPHCDVELASVRCAHCFSLHFSGARFCARCGKPLELEPLLDASDAPCPRCDTLLLASCTAGMNECGACGGIFVDHNAFAAIARERQAHRAPFDHDAHSPGGPLSANDAIVRYVKCPVCSERMNRINYGKRSGVIVDVCRLHGTWFDQGELTRVIEFVAAGGLDETRRRDRERHDAARTKAARGASELQVVMMQEEYRQHRRFRDDIASVDTLLDVIRFFFRSSG